MTASWNARSPAREGDQAGRPARRRHHGRRAGLQEQQEKILSYCTSAAGRRRSADRRRARGRRPLAGGYYIQPTILKGHNKMRVFQEEIFGPVVSVTTFKDEAERCHRQ
jgi:acyl-CoA reductase-like NAD-dependent aldehyde dehydrogenase